MTYSISEAARILGLAPSALRYYDKEGLLPFIQRTPNGSRIFSEDDFVSIRLIQCLKKTGLSLQAIREFIELPPEQQETAEKRLSILTAQQAILVQKMDELQDMMHLIDHKINKYQSALNAPPQQDQ